VWAYDRRPDVLTIGWTGSVGTHPYDLQEVGSGLQRALDATRGRSRFTILGQTWNTRGALGLSEEPTEVAWLPDVDSYVATLGELFDVGIAPLRIDRFNTSKSWLKGLEYAARGVAFVRSPTDEYERLGLGWRARNAKDWAKALTTLVQDDDRRYEQAAAARESVLAGHLTEHTAERWASAWRAAADRAARRRRTSA
jgi:hypothetical protein